MKKYKKSSILFSCLVLLGVFFIVYSVKATADESMGDSLLRAGAEAFRALTGFLLSFVTFGLDFFLKIAKYNGYVDSNTQIVVVGWTLVRDVANMFFVVILLAIAFGTILGVENYQWNKLLGKLIFAAIFINFSKMICGIFIDVAYIFSLTFLNAIVNTAQGNILNAFHMDKLLEFSSSASDTGPTPVVLLVSNFAAFMFAVMLFLTIGAYLVVMLARMVVLWLLIILSPLAFIFQVMPQTQEYAKQWWSKFTKQVLVLPVMTFFLWLTLATSSSGDIANTLGIGMDDSLLGGMNLSSSLVEITKFSTMANFFVPLAMLIVGLTMVGQMGVVGGGLTSKALDFAKKVATIASGYALGRKIVGGTVEGVVGGITKGAKATAKYGLMKFPVIGGESLIRKGKAIKSGASVAWSKVSGVRNEIAKGLEESSKERSKLQRELRQETDPEKKAAIQKKIDELGGVMGNIPVLSSVGRFTKRFLAGRIESSGRANKRAENYEEWAKSQREIEEGNYSLSDTLSGDLKTRKRAEAEVSKVKQESKAKTKVDKEVASIMRRDKAEMDTLKEQEREAQDALLEAQSSEHVNAKRKEAKEALDEARAGGEEKKQVVVKIEGEINATQGRINKLGGGLDRDVVKGVASLGNEVKGDLAGLFDLLSDEDKAKVIARRKKWNGGKDYEENHPEYQAQTGEALRQLLDSGNIEGSTDFNLGLKKLFIGKFREDDDEEVKSLVDKVKTSVDTGTENRDQLKIEEDLLRGKRKELVAANKAVHEYQQEVFVPKAEEAAKWTPQAIKVRIAKAEAEMNDASLSNEKRTEAQLEYSRLTSVSGTPEQIAEANARVAAAKARQKDLVGRSAGLQAVMAREQATVAAGQRSQAEAEAVNIVQATDAGAKLIDDLNRAEFGKKQAEEFAATLKTKKLNKVFNEAAKKMEDVFREWQKFGKGDLGELERKLKEASVKDVFVGGAVQSQRLEEAKSENTQASKKVENWAGDLSRNIPRGSRSPSTVMASLLKETEGQFQHYERADGSKAAVKHIFSAAMKRERGEELDLEDRRMAMGSWMKIDSESWNDDFFDAMVRMVEQKNKDPEGMDAQERNIAEVVERFLASSGAKVKMGKNGKYQTEGEYSRDFSAMLQNLASTGGDIDAAIAHKKVSERQRILKEKGETGEALDYWKVAEEVQHGGMSASTILKSSYDENQDYIQVAAKEFKKNALANGHMESGLNQEFDVTRGIYRFNTALEAEAGMLTEMSKRTQNQLLQAQIHSWGSFDINTGLLKNVSQSMFSGFTKNLKDIIELRSMNARTLAKLFGFHESEEVDKSGGKVRFGGAIMRKKFMEESEGDEVKAGKRMTEHVLKDYIMPELTGNAKAFGLMMERMFDLTEEQVAHGDFKIELPDGNTINGIDQLIDLLQGIDPSQTAQLTRIRDDWKAGNIIEQRRKSQPKSTPSTSTTSAPSDISDRKKGTKKRKDRRIEKQRREAERQALESGQEDYDDDKKAKEDLDDTSN